MSNKFYLSIAITLIAYLLQSCNKKESKDSNLAFDSTLVNILKSTENPDSTKNPIRRWDLGTSLSGNRIKISGSVEYNKDGYWAGHPDPKETFRVAIHSEDGYKDALTQTFAIQHDLLIRRGYMQTDKDWRNVEMSGLFNVSDIKDKTEEITMYVRGGKHNDNTQKESCQGTAYKISITFDGKPKLAKEMYHEGGKGYVFRKNIKTEFTVDPIINKWIGVKGKIINEYKGTLLTGVYIAMYINTDPLNKPNDWRLWFEDRDRGDWLGKSFVVNVCSAKSAQEIISWGGPTATFRIDKANTVLFNKLSIKEIPPIIQ